QPSRRIAWVQGHGRRVADMVVAQAAAETPNEIIPMLLAQAEMVLRVDVKRVEVFAEDGGVAICAVIIHLHSHVVGFAPLMRPATKNISAADFLQIGRRGKRWRDIKDLVASA